MASPVLEALAQARSRAAPMFARWCQLNGVSFCPASPAAVAKFVRDCASLGIDRLWPAVQEISKMHVALGLADPTLRDAAVAVNEVAGLVAPRSWPADRRQQFKGLPYDLQVYIAAHETQRERALRRAQNEAAGARQQLATWQKSDDVKDDTTIQKGGADEHDSLATA